MEELQKILEIRKKLKRKLDPFRYEHSLGVAFTAAALAMRYGENIGKAELAGTLHDCGKYGTEEALIKRCRKNGVALTEAELKSPAVIHAKYGRYLAEAKYGIRDQDILNAVAYHTTGRAGMSRLEKIVFIADYIEPLRDKAEDLPRMRDLAFRDLDRCMYEMLLGTEAYLKKKRSGIHPDSIEALHYFERLIKEERP